MRGAPTHAFFAFFAIHCAHWCSGRRHRTDLVKYSANNE